MLPFLEGSKVALYSKAGQGLCGAASWDALILNSRHPLSVRNARLCMQAETAQVCISDLDPDTVELLLRYCYGCLQELPSDHCQVTTRAHTSAVSAVPH